MRPSSSSSRAALVAAIVAAGLAASCAPPPALPSPGPTTVTAAPPTTEAATTTTTTTTTTTLPPGGWTCPAWNAASANAVTDHRISEASGLAASHRNPGIWWVHNDGPNSFQPVPASVYALDNKGKITATLDLTGATNVDWEDIDAVTLGGIAYLWVADVGDNSKVRPDVQLYRVAEPLLTTNGEVIAAAPDVVTLRYGGGAQYNVETTFVDPTNGDVYLITKEAPALVFKAAAAALQPGATITLGAPIATIDAVDHNSRPAAKPTGGDMSVDGSILAIKTLDRTFVWHRSPGQSVQNLLSRDPAGHCIYDDAADVQQGVTPMLPDLGHGEAIGLSPDGQQLATIAEGGQAPLRLFHG